MTSVGAGPVVVVVGCLAIAAALVAAPVSRVRSGRRLAGLPLRLTQTGPGGTGGPGGAGAAGRAARLRDPRVAAGLAAVAVAMLIGGWFGVLVGAGVAIAVDRGLRRLEPAASRQRREAEAALLPLAADLLAVALRGGTPVDQAALAVAAALPGPLGDRLARVGRVLSLGGTPNEAWAQLRPVAGADRLVRACVRSAEHGGALAGALGRLADDLRTDRAIAVDAAGRRAAVLIVLPLGLCFLPAFVLAGLVPVIIAVLGDVVSI